MSGGNELARAVVVVGSLGSRTRRRSRIVMPGVTIRKPRLKRLLAGRPDGVDRLPGDQHRHDGGLAAARRHLHGDAQQLGVGLFVGAFEVFPELGVALLLARDFGQPDDGFRGFDLAEEGADALEVMVPPVRQQTRRRRRDAPVSRVGQLRATTRRASGFR